MIEKYQSAQIIPSIIQTSNGDYALLLWDKAVDQDIVTAIEQGHTLGNYCLIGVSETPYGPLSWMLSAIGTVEEFADPNSTLFWFDYIVNPGKITSYEKRWFKILSKQSSLSLGIPLGTKIRPNGLISDRTLATYLEGINHAIAHWHIGCDYAAAVEWLWKNELDELVNEAMREIPQKYGNRNGQEVLVDCLGQAATTVLDSAHPLCQIYEQGQLGTYLQAWKKTISLSDLKERSQDPAENLKRDWLFASTCLTKSENPLKIAVGSINGTWIWADFPYKSSRPESLYLLSKTYRYLLGHNFKPLLHRNDALLNHLELPAVASLGKIPQRSSFDQVGRILQGAILDREFALLQPTAILVGKRGLEEVEYHPLTRGGVSCLFKVRLMADSNRGTNLVLVGKLNAASGVIEAIGIKETPEVKLILFLVAIAYRDILVARNAATVPSKGREGKGKSPRRSLSPPVKLVARVKQSRTQIQETFADPQQLVQSLRKYSSYLRSCHLRRLHEGWNASEKALKVAEQYQWLVPEGFTFVKPAIVEGDSEFKLREEFKSISLMDLLFG